LEGLGADDGLPGVIDNLGSKADVARQALGIINLAQPELKEGANVIVTKMAGQLVTVSTWVGGHRDLH
jgi:hypothetical protein